MRYLVVANVTLGSEPLERAVHERHGRGPAEFFLLVPATTPQSVPDEYLRGLRHRGAPADDERESPIAAAQSRLRMALLAWRAAGIAVEGKVGPPDPVRAVVTTLARNPADEIVVSTLEPGPSRWIRMDLVSRLQRRTGLPIAHVVAEKPLRV